MDANGNDKLAAISAEAARWFVQLRDGTLNIAGQYQYLLWLKESPAHVAEMLRACQVYVLLQAAKLESSSYRVEDSPNVIALGSREGAPSSGARADVRRWKRAAAFAGVAATALLAVVATTAWRTRAIATEVGEWRTLTLADGSTLKMGPRSRVRIDFDDASRDVHFDRGEARFQVAHEPARPFTVRSELATLRAVGTDFGVERAAEGLLRVTVAKGAVAVSESARGEKARAGFARFQLPADRQVSIGGAGPGRMQRIDSQRVLAWADGWLVFEGETLGEAVQEFNRRNRLQIVLSDAGLSAKKLVGRFEAGNPRSFVSAVALLDDALTVREEHETLRIERRPAR
jgi:transmembrane sensor